MAPERPRISIGMPAYDAARHLHGSIRSLLEQTREDFEILVTDNASTDETADIVGEFAALDPRVRHVRLTQNVGSRRNYNLAFELARGEYFMWARAHDRWDPALLERATAVLDADHDVALVHATAQEIDAAGERTTTIAESLETRGLPTPDRLRAVWRDAVGPAAHGVIRRTAMTRTRRYLDIAGCDILFLLELGIHGAFAHLDEPMLFLRRVREEASEQETIERTRLQMNPFAGDVRRPFDAHMLDFCRHHLRIIEDAPLDDDVRTRLQDELVTDYATKFLGSLERCSRALARVVLDRFGPDASREFAPSFEATHLLEQVQLAMLFRPDDALLVDSRAILLAYLGAGAASV